MSVGEWTSADVAREGYVVAVPPAAAEELRAFAQRHPGLDFRPPGPVGAETDVASLVQCAALMAEARRRIDAGLGFVVLDRVPVEDLDLEHSRTVAWALFSCTGRVVDQKVSGTKVYDVQDTGAALGYGVRRSITNLDQELHTDAGWLDAPPEVIGLFCREPAEEGGVNRLLSLVAVHAILDREHPALLARLHRPFRWDRQSEHGPDEPKTSAQPVFFRTGGKLNARYYDDYVRNGQRLAGEALDEAGEAALAAMRAVVERPELAVELRLERGQYLLVNNREVAHSRSAFSGPGGRRSRRHYLRLWSRRGGSTRLDG